MEYIVLDLLGWDVLKSCIKLERVKKFISENKSTSYEPIIGEPIIGNFYTVDKIRNWNSRVENYYAFKLHKLIGLERYSKGYICVFITIMEEWDVFVTKVMGVKNVPTITENSIEYVKTFKLDDDPPYIPIDSRSMIGYDIIDNLFNKFFTSVDTDKKLAYGKLIIKIFYLFNLWKLNSTSGSLPGVGEIYLFNQAFIKCSSLKKLPDNSIDYTFIYADKKQFSTYKVKELKFNSEKIVIFNSNKDAEILNNMSLKVGSDSFLKVHTEEISKLENYISKYRARITSDILGKDRHGYEEKLDKLYRDLKELKSYEIVKDAPFNIDEHGGSGNSSSSSSAASNSSSVAIPSPNMPATATATATATAAMAPLGSSGSDTGNSSSSSSAATPSPNMPVTASAPPPKKEVTTVGTQGCVGDSCVISGGRRKSRKSKKARKSRNGKKKGKKQSRRRV